MPNRQAYSSQGSSPAASIVDHINSKANIDTSNNPIIFNNVGNIGIQQTSPTASLHVDGQVKVEDDVVSVVTAGQNYRWQSALAQLQPPFSFKLIQ